VKKTKGKDCMLNSMLPVATVASREFRYPPSSTEPVLRITYPVTIRELMRKQSNENGTVYKPDEYELARYNQQGQESTYLFYPPSKPRV
jgi:hypothetical protein